MIIWWLFERSRGHPEWLEDGFRHVFAVRPAGSLLEDETKQAEGVIRVCGLRVWCEDGVSLLQSSQKIGAGARAVVRGFWTW